MCLEFVLKVVKFRKPKKLIKFMEKDDSGNYISPNQKTIFDKRTIIASGETIQSHNDEEYKAGIHGYPTEREIKKTLNPHEFKKLKEDGFLTTFWNEKVYLQNYIIPAGAEVTIGTENDSCVFVANKIINARARPQISDFSVETLFVPDEVKARIDKSGLSLEYNYK